jgi:hypothetical protein
MNLLLIPHIPSFERLQAGGQLPPLVPSSYSKPGGRILCQTLSIVHAFVTRRAAVDRLSQGNRQRQLHDILSVYDLLTFSQGSGLSHRDRGSVMPESEQAVRKQAREYSQNQATTTCTWNRSTRFFDRSARTLIGLQRLRTRDRRSEHGVKNIMRVVLTGRWVRGRRTKSPMSSRLAANSLANKLPMTHSPGDTGKGGPIAGSDVIL